MSDMPAFDPQERERGMAERIRLGREERRLKAIPDEDGISIAMVDKMVAIWAEGLNTGEHNVRNLLYCAYREARKLEPRQ